MSTQSSPPAAQITELDLAQFQRDGYLLMRNLCPLPLVEQMRKVVQTALQPILAPVEYEADVGYPGSPRTKQSAGGETPRRLLQAIARHPVFKQWALLPPLVDTLRQIMACQRIAVSQNHHNCVMTKHPGYSSATLWHQDIRYWSFDKPELVSAWLALTPEDANNGALQLIPGSHQLELDRGRLDKDLFLRPELAENAALIESARTVELNPGDVLMFHCRTFHAAGQNHADKVKLSTVFTYHDVDNQPIPGTRSAQYPSIDC